MVSKSAPACPQCGHRTRRNSPVIVAAVVLLILLVGVLLAGPGQKFLPPQNTTITGQVFIATKGGETVKLAVVKVTLVKSSDGKSELSRIQASARPIVGPLQKQADEIFRRINSSNALTLHKEYKAAQKEADDALRREANLEQLWVRAQATTTTDSEGRFTLSAPPGDYVLIAQCERETGNTTEFYQWAVPVKGSNVDLNNANLWTWDFK